VPISLIPLVLFQMKACSFAIAHGAKVVLTQAGRHDNSVFKSLFLLPVGDVGIAVLEQARATAKRLP
jgi:hypothetical protein